MTFKDAQKTLGVWGRRNSHFLLPIVLVASVVFLQAVVGWWAGLLALAGLGWLLYRSYLVAEHGEEVFTSEADRKRAEEEARKYQEELLREEAESFGKKRKGRNKVKKSSKKTPISNGKASKGFVGSEDDDEDEDEDLAERMAREQLLRNPHVRAKHQDAAKAVEEALGSS